MDFHRFLVAVDFYSKTEFLSMKINTLFFFTIFLHFLGILTPTVVHAHQIESFFFQWEWELKLAFLLLLGTLMWLARLNRRLRQEVKKRKQTEEKLQQATEWLQATFDNTAVGIAVISTERIILDANLYLCEILGYQREELVGQSTLLVHPSHKAYEKFAAFYLHIADRKFQNIEYQLKHKDGHLLWCMLSLRPFRLGEAQKGIIIVAVDISQHKQTEKALREERRLFIGGPTVIFRWKAAPGWPVEYVSPNIFQHFGYHPEDLTSGRIPFAQLVHPDDLARVAEEVSRYSDSKIPCFEQEYRLLNATGEYRWLNDFTVVIRDADEKITHYHGYALDITERKQMEKTFQESESRFRLMFQKHDAIMLLLEPESGRLVDANQAAQRFYGYSKEQLCTMTVQEINTLPPEEIKQERLRALQEQRNYFIFSHRLANGEMRTVEVHSSPIHFQEKPLLFSIIHDITERKQTEEALKLAKEQAESATRAKSEFLANMSHEIRTPLNAVIGLTNLLLETRLNQEQRDYMETLRASSETLLVIINDILDLSKIEAGKLELEQSPFQLRACIEQALDLQVVQAAKKDLNLAYQMSLETPECVEGDITRLRQVLVNLLANAVKFTHHGEVLIEVRAEPLATKPNYYKILFAVKDTGIGISSEGMQKLFQAFSQVDTSMTRKYGGTGLGLTISKRLVEMMGGEITVTSEEGQGTTFWFSITAPFANLSQNPYRCLHAPNPALANQRVLLLNLQPGNFQIIEQLLSKWNMQANSADSLLEALKLAGEGKQWDAAIMETANPHGGNRLLVEKLRFSHPRRQLPLIALTTHCSKAYNQPPFVTCLSKPLKPLKLYQLFNELLLNQGISSTMPDSETIVSAPHPPAIDLRILLVEDNPVNQKVALLTLQKLGYQAQVANNGVEALKILQQETYDVVLMDVQMPEMDGLTATRRIAEMFPTAQRPCIIAMTANAMEGDREACLAAGMQDYLSKPIRREELAAALKRSQIYMQRTEEK